jgi:hypothetical protein
MCFQKSIHDCAVAAGLYIKAIIDDMKQYEDQRRRHT